MSELLHTVELALREASATLLRAGIERGRVESEILLGRVLGLRRLNLIAYSERPLSDQERGEFRRLVDRRASRYPLPYLTGEREFMGLTFHVNQHVLIPRPETETLVEAAIAALRDGGRGTGDGSGQCDGGRGTGDGSGSSSSDQSPGTGGRGDGETGRRGDGETGGSALQMPPISSISSIPSAGGQGQETGASRIPHPASRIPHRTSPLAIDVGTGSGCIAISLARFVPEARVLATDVSPEACSVARLNACRLGVADRVSVLEGDLLSPLEEVTGAAVPPALRAAVVCANLPYIPEEHLKDLQPEVRDWEPPIALGGGPGGLDVVERFLGQVVRHLRPGGHLFLEIGPEAEQSARLVATLTECGVWRRIRVLPDLAGLPRVVAAVYEP